QERFAALDFIRFGIAVLRRPALDHVGDVDVVARQADRLDDFRQQLPGAADERNALDVLVAARRLADEHQVGVRVADAEHDLRASERVQLAARAVADVGADGGERLGGVARKRDRRSLGRSVRRLPGPAAALAPGRVAADAGDAELAGKFEMFDELIAVHGKSATERNGSGYSRTLRAASSLSTRSRISAATRDLACSGNGSGPSGPTMVTALVSTSKPASLRETSLATMRSACLRSRFAAAEATTFSVSAAKPMRTGPSPFARRRLPRSPRMPGVFFNCSVSVSPLFATFCPARSAGV